MLPNPYEPPKGQETPEGQQQSSRTGWLAEPLIIAYYVLPLVTAVVHLCFLGGGILGWVMLGVGLFGH